MSSFLLHDLGVQYRETSLGVSIRTLIREAHLTFPGLGSMLHKHIWQLGVPGKGASQNIYWYPCGSPLDFVVYQNAKAAKSDPFLHVVLVPGTTLPKKTYSETFTTITVTSMEKISWSLPEMIFHFQHFTFEPHFLHTTSSSLVENWDLLNIAAISIASLCKV